MRGRRDDRVPGIPALPVALILFVVLLPLGPTNAASGPSLSYSVTPQAYNNTVRVGPSGLMDSPRIVVGPDPGNLSQEDVYAVGLNTTYVGGPNGTSCTHLIVIRSTDGGRSFGSPQNENVCVPGGRVDAVILPNGTLVVSVGPRILRSIDGGANWTQTQAFTTSATFSSLALDASTGRLYLVWSDYTDLAVTSSADGGVTWGAPATIPVLSMGFAPQIAARAGRVIVGFNDLGTAKSGSVAVAAFIASFDGGTTWSSESLLVDPANATSYHASPVTVTVSSAGMFALVWYQATDQPAWSNATMAVLSRDGGATWSAPMTVGTFPNLFTDYLPDIAVFDSEDRLFVSWHNYSADFSSDFLTVASSDRSLATFNTSAFSINFRTASHFNATTAENLAADHASRVFLLWIINAGTNPSSSDVGLFVRTVTGAASGDVQTAPKGSATVTLRTSSTGAAVRTVNWTGQAFLLPELPPDAYQVWIDSGNGSALAGTIPIQPWSQTTFTVHASGISTGPAPPFPFPWLLVGVLVGGVVVFSAALVTVHYTRLTRETALQRQVRVLLYEHVRGHPGASFSAVRDALGLQNGAAAYHLTVLEKQGFLHSETKGRRHFYYPDGNPALWKDLPLSQLQDSILQAVRTTPGIGLRELGRAIGRGPSSVEYNVRALAREGLLRTDRDGLRVRCYPAEGNASG